MVSFIQLLVAFSVIVQLIDSEPIPDDVICELIMNAIHDHDLAPLVGKHCRHQSNAENAVQKRAHAHIEYKHETRELR
jgi:hypothetical protein